MPITNAIPAFGTLLKRGDGATPEVFTAIAEVGDIAGPSLKSQMEDATNHGSTGGYTESMPTVKSMGQLKFPISFIPSNATHSAVAGMIYDWVNKTKRNYQMVFPDGTVWTLPVYVAEFSLKAPVKTLLVADVALEITGAPTLA